MRSTGVVLIAAAVALLALPAGVFARAEVEEEGAAEPAEPALPAEMDVGEYQEHPLLTEMVRQGLLPPLQERLPTNPKVVEPLHEIGQYGGTANIYEQPGTLFSTASPFTLSPELIPGLPHVYSGYEVNDNFTEWTFFLRPGLKWSDGEPLTAWTMYEYWRYYRANPAITPIISSAEVTIEERAVTFKDEPREGTGLTVRKEVIDDHTIKYTSDKPYWALLNQMSHGASMLEGNFRPMHFLKQLDPEFIGEEDAQKLAESAGFEHWYQLYTQVGRSRMQGTGQEIGNLPPTLEPYVLVEVGPTRSIYERNPFYWAVDPEGNQLPYIDRIFRNETADTATLEGKIIAGDVDWAAMDTLAPSLPLFKQYEDQGGYRTTVWQNTFTTLVLWFNYCYGDEVVAKAFQDRDFRLAMQFAVDKNRINDEVFFGQARAVRHMPKPETNILYDPALETVNNEYDPERSAELLDQAGYLDTDGDGWRENPDGDALSFTIQYLETETPRTPVLEIMLEDYHQLGLNIDSLVIEGSLHWPMYGANELVTMLWHGQSQIPISQDRDWHGSPGQSSGACWYNWYYSNGQSGVEPPPDAIQFYDWYKEYRFAATMEERIEAGRKTWQSQAENIWFVDTVTDFPKPVVTKDDMMNVPNSDDGPLFWSWDVNWPKAYEPVQFFFAGRPLITASNSLLPEMYDPDELAKHPITRAVDYGWVGTR
jgi:peptide/nickel transport system substrate-binding protein